MPKRQSRYATRLRKAATDVIIEQTPENVRDDNKQRENKTLHVKVCGGSDQSGRSDDSCLGEPPGQKVHQRMLNGTA
jgi:hypothetical protein